MTSIAANGAIVTPGSVPSGSSFNPTSLITGNGGFWRADMGVTGSPSVTAWADQSSFGNNLTVGSAASPTFSATGWLSAFPGLTYAGGTGNGGSGLFKVGPAFNSTTATGFVLVLWTSYVNFSFARFLSLTGNSSTDYNDPHSFAIDQSSNTNAQFEYNTNTPSYGTEAANTPYLFGVVFDGVNATAWKNGVAGSQIAVSVAIGDSTPANNNLSIGHTSIAASTYASSLIGTIAFAGLTQKAMNTTDWGNLKTWSNSNWGTSF